MAQNPEALGSLVPIQGGAPNVAVPGDAVTSPASFGAEDAVFPALPLVAAGMVGRNNHPLITFAADADEQVHFAGAMLADYGVGPINLHLQWAAESAVVGNVRWFVAWERDNAGGPFDLDVDSFAVEKSVLSTAPAASGSLRVASLAFTQAEADGVQAGDSFRLRIRRSGGVADDDMLGDAQLLRVTLEGG